MLQDPRKLSASASDKASRYFTDLQHLRKKFWERYRHLLIPMIRTQIEKSGIKRLTRTATSHGLRQTKRSGEAPRSNYPKERQATSFIIPKTSPLAAQIVRSWGIWGHGIQPFKKLQNPNRSYPFGKFQRFGRSKIGTPSTKTKSSEGMTIRVTKSGRTKGVKAPENNKEKLPSVLHYLAYSVLRK